MTADGGKKIMMALWRGFVTTLWVLRELARTAWSIARPPLIFALNVLAALIVLFEEWGWRPLSEFLARLARFSPIAAIERWIAGLPPYAALLVFALPTALLLPLKFVAIWLLANDQWWAATALFFGAKVVSTALIARVFILAKPTLMRLEWFARAYNWFIPWKEHLFGLIRASWPWRYGRMVKNRIKHETRQAWARLKPQADALWQRVSARLRQGRGATADAARQIGKPTDADPPST